MSIDNMMSLFDEFLSSYKKIELECIGSTSINSEDVRKLMDISKEMIQKRLVSENSFDFSSEKNFLNSVKTYINNNI